MTTSRELREKARRLLKAALQHGRNRRRASCPPRLWPQQTRSLRILAAVLALAFVSSVTRAHSFYTGLVNSQGQGCCGGQDCAPVAPADFRRDRWGDYQVFRDGSWLPVAPESILTIQSPDSRVHACVWGGEVKCLILPATI
jgi:hypothetical protein